jgi:hypothetical protein
MGELRTDIVNGFGLYQARGADLCRSAEPIESDPETALAHAVALRRELP